MSDMNRKPLWRAECARRIEYLAKRNREMRLAIQDQKRDVWDLEDRLAVADLRLDAARRSSSDLSEKHHRAVAATVVSMRMLVDSNERARIRSREDWWAEVTKQASRTEEDLLAEYSVLAKRLDKQLFRERSSPRSVDEPRSVLDSI